MPLTLRTIGWLAAAVCLAWLPPAHAAMPAPQQPVRCAALTTLRNLASHLALVTNPRTGDSFEYLVVGDAAKSNDLLLMFQGTGQVFPDWPIQMITNLHFSPRIALNNAYVPSQDGDISLCHDYRLVLFDYPGVGNGTLVGQMTGDRVANDVDAMLDDIATRYRVPTNRVDPVGWSLGTHLALKYALLSPAARPDRSIANIVLIGTRPGGNTDGFTDGNQAACIADTLKAVESPQFNRRLSRAIDVDLFKLTFPYVGQQPYDGIDSSCRSTVDAAAGTVRFNVRMSCPLGSECGRNLLSQAANRLTRPWSRTRGLPANVYDQERAFDHDWNICYCPSAGSGFTSTGCSCSAPVVQSATNGGVCQTVSTGVTTPNAPISTHCAPLKIAGRLTVINGRDDLFIQWTYGRALVRGMQQALGPDKAVLMTYGGPGGAGHGVHMQYPKWTQARIAEALVAKPQ